MQLYFTEHENLFFCPKHEIKVQMFTAKNHDAIEM